MNTTQHHYSVSSTPRATTESAQHLAPQQSAPHHHRSVSSLGELGVVVNVQYCAVGEGVYARGLHELLARLFGPGLLVFFKVGQRERLRVYATGTDGALQRRGTDCVALCAC